MLCRAVLCFDVCALSCAVRFLRYEPFCHLKYFKLHVKEAITQNPENVREDVLPHWIHGCMHAILVNSSAFTNKSYRDRQTADASLSLWGPKPQ